jgi:hypothetical protein
MNRRTANEFLMALMLFVSLYASLISPDLLASMVLRVSVLLATIYFLSSVSKSLFGDE